MTCMPVRAQTGRGASMIEGWVRAPALRRRAHLAALISGRLEVHVADKRGRIAEREDLGRPISAKPVLAIDPIERVGEPGPTERTGRSAGRRVLVVEHEGVAPRFLQAG